MQPFNFVLLLVATSVLYVQATAQSQPSVRDVACPSCKPAQAAPKLADDCPQAMRKLLRGGGGGGGGHSGGGGGGFRAGGGGGHAVSAPRSYSGGHTSSYHSTTPTYRPQANNGVTQQHHANNNNNQQHRENHDDNNNHNQPSYNGNNNWGTGSYWPGYNNYNNYNTYDNYNTYVRPSGPSCIRPEVCPINTEWLDEACECVQQEQDVLSGLLGGLLGRKLRASTRTNTATSVDNVHIERTNSKQGPEPLPARPQHHNGPRLRRVYKHKCRPDQPCGPATISRSYKITAKPQ